MCKRDKFFYVQKCQCARTLVSQFSSVLFNSIPFHLCRTLNFPSQSISPFFKNLSLPVSLSTSLSLCLSNSLAVSRSPYLHSQFHYIFNLRHYTSLPASLFPHCFTLSISHIHPITVRLYKPLSLPVSLCKALFTLTMIKLLEVAKLLCCCFLAGVPTRFQYPSVSGSGSHSALWLVGAVSCHCSFTHHIANCLRHRKSLNLFANERFLDFWFIFVIVNVLSACLSLSLHLVVLIQQVEIYRIYRYTVLVTPPLFSPSLCLPITPKSHPRKSIFSSVKFHLPLCLRSDIVPLSFSLSL